MENNKDEERRTLYVKDTSLIAEVYKNDRLVLKRYFSKDTIQFGPEINYNLEGKIIKWKWYNNTNKYAEIIVSYDSNGNYKSFKGNPFLQQIITSEGKTAIQMINIPNIKYKMGYKTFKEGKLIRKQLYLPDNLNGTAWVTLDDHKAEKNKKYYVYYYFLDNSGKLLDSSYIEI